MDPHDRAGVHDQLGIAHQRFLADREHAPDEDKTILEKGIANHIHEMKNKERCAFCQHPGFIKIDDSAIIVCMHCFKIISENISSLKAFLGSG